ncbi:tRNA glutamyl-Q(34) synthetase GluQRS, partial [Desulfovibrio sp. OttesenSCG-928-A18]|nr:tRNA glutamyl-Q(34) synthetase GluQRS [Desulfovibrio sp. OttesenSCG-928-A18]
MNAAPAPGRQPHARGRLAPSPTGFLHLGNAFAFLCAWLSIRKQSGTLVLRMEDIDPERSRPEFAAAILRDLDWLGLDWDEGPGAGEGPETSSSCNMPGVGPCAPYTQSLRIERYASALLRLEERKLIYPCYCSRKELRLLASAPHIGDEGVPYPGICRQLDDAGRRKREREGRRACLRLDTEGAYALAVASGLLSQNTQSGDSRGAYLHFADAVLGEQRFCLQDCGGDFALRRSDGVVAYQLAVSVDDAAMGITEVIRGEDLLLSTPRQLLLLALLGCARPPAYAHVPLLHDAHGMRLAKRHKSLELRSLRAAGIRPEAVVGYLGWLAGLQAEEQSPLPARASELLPL